VHLVLTHLAVRHRTLPIEVDTLNFPTSELKEQVNALGHMNIVISRIPIQILQYFQMGLLQEIKSRGYESHQALTKMIEERDQLQQ
jgi:hypothetical protein